MSATPEPDPRNAGRGSHSAGRLTRVQQLTLNLWRHASAAVGRRVMPNDVLAQVAIQAVLAALRDTTNPLDLFVRHQHCEHEYALVGSLFAPDRVTDDILNLLDSGFLLRWQELTIDGRGPEELPPLKRAVDGPQRLLP